ncbi:flagellar hook assembly protein FlgD [Pararhodospirillum oryzae]|uniref:Basal-body rod modification protein FlgD n=1 Tax=Pararhodospirillum oryzae TaxID=478448 RepID=A0A512H4I4_9PROT|nr:flagellar hook capping FlgD N-terminal domain-containing protein [Pararhodospirillum oryzae]GEO80343.1 basal-body rod modification protein FlgD [Pararhodospirillum oryzae]
MSIDSTSTVATTYSSGLSTTTASSLASLSDNYDMFISLLTAQLQNQSPLDPTDTDELTQQLLSYSSIEQQILSNQYLENLVLATSNDSSQVALSFLGKEVTYDASEQNFSGDALSWAMTVPDEAESLTIEIQNENGLTVFETTVEPDAGSDYTYTWDGTKTSGATADDGDYTLVVTANLADDTTESVDLEATSIARQVVWTSGAPELVLANGDTTGLDTIISARTVDETDA